MKKFFSDFKTFVSQGNVMDMAVGIIIGAAFKDIVNSFVEDIIMPLLGLLIGKMEFNKLVWSPYGVEIRYGMFIQKTIDFILIALCIFIFIRVITNIRERAEKELSKLKKPAGGAEGQTTQSEAQDTAQEEAPLSQTDLLLSEIKELLKKQAGENG